MNSGARGVEIIISGKIPGSRAKSWRFLQGYLKKSGDIAISGVRHAQVSALLKSGIIGVKVAIMPPDIEMPDHVEVLKELAPASIEEVKEEKLEDKKVAKKKTPAKKKIVKKKETASDKEPATDAVDIETPTQTNPTQETN